MKNHIETMGISDGESEKEKKEADIEKLVRKAKDENKLGYDESYLKSVHDDLKEMTKEELIEKLFGGGVDEDGPIQWKKLEINDKEIVDLLNIVEKRDKDPRITELLKGLMEERQEYDALNIEHAAEIQEIKGWDVLRKKEELLEKEYGKEHDNNFFTNEKSASTGMSLDEMSDRMDLITEATDGDMSFRKLYADKDLVTRIGGDPSASKEWQTLSKKSLRMSLGLISNEKREKWLRKQNEFLESYAEKLALEEEEKLDKAWDELYQLKVEKEPASADLRNVKEGIKRIEGYLDAPWTKRHEFLQKSINKKIEELRDIAVRRQRVVSSN